jgi:hypothetical protein
MEILTTEECDFLEFYDDSDVKFYAKSLFNIDDNQPTHIFTSKISKISVLIDKKYNTGGANKIIVNPILKPFLQSLKSYFDNPIENLSCRYVIEYDEHISYDNVFVLYDKGDLKFGGIIQLKNHNLFNLDEILDKIHTHGIESLTKNEIIYLENLKCDG